MNGPSARSGASKPSGRRIVLCIDGTNNAPTTARTNVSRLFRMVDKSAPDQLAYYQPGVGTLDPFGVDGPLRRRVRRAWDLATAWMIGRHVTSAYRYLMQQHQPGDEIYLFGFSRGAYTARVLAGMLHRVGLLYSGQDEMVGFAWNLYRQADAEGDHERAGRFKRYYGRSARVTFLGLFDTVRSVGTPWRPRSFPNTYHNPAVAQVRHALALDERRAMYVTNLWTLEPPARQHVVQAWFPGVHADIGGGYGADSDAGIGTIPLTWMVREAEAAGLRFLDAEKKRLLWRRDQAIRDVPDVRCVTEEFAADPVHDEIAAHWYWRLVEQIPLPHRGRGPEGKWGVVWRRHLSSPREVPEGTVFHESVFARASRVAGYAPTNLPALLPPDRRVG